MSEQDTCASSYLKNNGILIGILFVPLAIFIFTVGRYYGFFYDNHYFSLLALDLLSGFKLYAYIGSHYSVHSSLLSYLFYPFFVLLCPGKSANFSGHVLYLLGQIFVEVYQYIQ